jgi:hypothetical protein
MKGNRRRTLAPFYIAALREIGVYIASSAVWEGIVVLWQRWRKRK